MLAGFARSLHSVVAHFFALLASALPPLESLHRAIAWSLSSSPEKGSGHEQGHFELAVAVFSPLSSKMEPVEG